MVRISAHQVPLSFTAYLRSELILRKVGDSQIGSIVEVGAGQGAMGLRLAAGRRYLGFEPDASSYNLARSRLSSSDAAEIVNTHLPNPPTHPRHFDALVAFEVLEHQMNDKVTLRSWVGWVRPGGLVMISVPAHQKRFNDWDRSVGHFRRYERSDLARLMTEVGLEKVEVFTYGFPLGHILEWVRSHVFARSIEEAEMKVLTSSSGRLHQPAGFDLIRRLLVWPFRKLQKLFYDSDLGIGYVAWGSVPYE